MTRNDEGFSLQWLNEVLLGLSWLAKRKPNDGSTVTFRVGADDQLRAGYEAPSPGSHYTDDELLELHASTSAGVRAIGDVIEAAIEVRGDGKGRDHLVAVRKAQAVIDYHHAVLERSFTKREDA